MKQSDFVIIGAGIVGLTIALELKKRHPDSSVVVVEKEVMPGLHSSGRNSGVLHSGIYYPPNTLKAKVCSKGAKELMDYCERKDLPLLKCGKILVATRHEDDPQIDFLLKNAKENNIDAEEIDQYQLKSIEPDAFSISERAILVSSTSVADSKLVLKEICNDAESKGIKILNQTYIKKVDVKKRCIRLNNDSSLNYGHLVNSAGLQADKIAHSFGIGRRYKILPFKGIYWKLSKSSGINLNHLIYPVPDLRVPFLGVHATLSTSGEIYLGPTAVPSFGRENYSGFDDLNIYEGSRILLSIFKQIIYGKNGFRRLAWSEGRRMFKPWFLEASRAIIPKLKSENLLRSSKIGIRAQLYDEKEGVLVNDFMIKNGPNSTHILNAISPAWTSSFPFARYVVDIINGENSGY